MRAKSITIIRDILTQKTQIAADSYKTIKDNLEKRYNSEWLDGVITQPDQKMLDGARSEYYEIASVLEDFENHQW